MSTPRLHWFKDNRSADLAIVIASEEKLLSPIRMREQMDAQALTINELAKLVKDSGQSFNVNVYVDKQVPLKAGVQDLLGTIRDDIVQQINSFVFRGQFDLCHTSSDEENGQDSFMRRRVSDLFGSVQELAPLDSTGKRLLTLKNKLEYTERDFFDVIKHDAPLSGQLMNWANSAFYGTGKYKDINSAVRQTLGIEKALVLCIGLCIQSSFKIEKDLKPHLGAYLLRCIYVSNLVQQVSRHVFIPHDKNLIALCGLLHNLGEMVVMQIAPGMYRHYIDFRQCNPSHSQEFVQKASMGFTCLEMGKALAERWGLPAALVDTIEKAHLGVSDNERSTNESRIVVFTKRILADAAITDTPYDLPIEPANLGLTNEQIQAELEIFESHKPYYQMLAQSMTP
ncbi:HDOD domain-containing protein [Pseudomonas luteola]